MNTTNERKIIENLGYTEDDFYPLPQPYGKTYIINRNGDLIRRSENGQSYLIERKFNKGNARPCYRINYTKQGHTINRFIYVDELVDWVFNHKKPGLWKKGGNNPKGINGSTKKREEPKGHVMSYFDRLWMGNRQAV